MDVDQIIEKHGLTRSTAQQYIDASTRLNQTEAAEELDVSRDTIRRYKNAFQEMEPVEHVRLIASLGQDEFLDRATEG